MCCVLLLSSSGSVIPALARSISLFARRVLSSPFFSQSTDGSLVCNDVQNLRHGLLNGAQGLLS
jgi:hypothetical protein